MFWGNNSSGHGLWEREPGTEGGGYDHWSMKDGEAKGGRIGEWALTGGTQLPQDASGGINLLCAPAY